MWNEHNKVWLHYVNDIIAADVYSAVFLSTYLRHAVLHKKYVASLEVLDLQKYKVIKQEHKVRAAIRERLRVPFVFLVGKN